MRRLSRWLRFGAALSISSAFALLVAPPDTAAQVKVAIDSKKDGKKKREDFTDGLFLFVDREASTRVEAFKAYLKKDKIPWNELCDAIQTLLENPVDKLVETYRDHPTEGRIKVKVSLKEELNRILAAFNKEGREFYQLTYGPRAEARLREALSADGSDGSDPMRKMADVAATYLHTKAGAEAILRLGTWHLDRGRYLMAALTLRKFETRNPDEPLSPSILLKLAIAYKRLGEPKQADDYWNRLLAAVPSKELVLGTRKFTVDQLKAEFDRIVVKSRSEATEWVSIGGNSTHNAQGVGSRPFLDPRFSASMMPERIETDKDGKEISSTKPGMDWIRQNLQLAMDRIAKQPNPAAIPAFFPVTLPGRIIFRTYEGVQCVLTQDTSDGGKAGEIDWRQETEASLYSIIKVPNLKNTFEKQWYQPFYAQQGPHGIMFENGLVGSLSHDGKYVYFIDDLFVPPHPMQMFNYNQSGQQMNFGQFQDFVFRNRLTAVEIETGKLVWKTGERPPENKKKEPRDEKQPETAASLFADAFFLGAPLSVAGKLYIVIEKDREMVLACVNPTKIGADQYPDLEWFQPLGSPQSPLPQDSFRRIQGVHLSYADGILVCPTNAGAIVGIDLQTRNIVWSHSYRKAVAKAPEQDDGMNGRRFRGGMMMNGEGMPLPTISPDRWRVSYPILSQNKVVFTAYDGESIQCLDLRAGGLSWESARNSDDLYVAGVFENRVMVVGKAAVRFLSLADGVQIGSGIPIGVPSGVGTASAGMYLLPIKESPESKEPEIWTIDTAKATVIAKTKSRKKTVVGNLIFHEGDVFSQSAFELTAFPQLQVKKDEMVKRLAADPNDPVGLLALGELQLDDGELLLAITTLKKVLARDIPGDIRERARTKLYEAMTEYVQRDFLRAEPYLAEYKELCSVVIPAGTDPVKKKELIDDERKRRSNYYAMVGKGRELQGRLLEAFENYQTFGNIPGASDLVSVPDQPFTSARPDVWARGRLGAMIRNATPENRKPLEDKINENWKKVEGANDLEQLRSFAKLFGNPELEAGNESRLLLAKKLSETLNEEDMRESEMLLLNLRAVRDPSVAARATDLLARAYMKRNSLDEAIRMYQRLGGEFAAVKLPDGRTGEQVFSELVTDKRFLPYLEPAQVTWNEKLKAREIVGGTNVAGSFPVQPDDEDSSPFFERHRVFVDTISNSANQWCLRVQDRLTGKEVFHSKPLLSPQAASIWMGNHPQFNYNRLYQIKGHILVLQSMNMVYAFDLATKSEIWPGAYNLFGKNPPLMANNGQLIQPAMDKDGDLRIMYADGTSQRMGRIGLLQPNYLCLLTREGIVALDPVTGSTLWVKKNVQNIRLFGDQEHIFFYELNPSGSASAPWAVRASDGVEVPVPDNALLLGTARHLRFQGRNVLMHEDVGDKHEIRMVDMLTGKEVWKHTSEEPSVLASTDSRSLVGFSSKNGNITLFDGATGKAVFSTRLKADAELRAAQFAKVDSALVMVDREQLFVGLNRGSDARSGMGVINTIHSAPFNGVLYAFDRRTGEQQWYSDEQLENQNIILDRFAEMPVIIAASHSNFNQGNQFRAVILDKKTGRLLYGEKPLYGNANPFNSLLIDARAKTIELIRNDMRIRLAADTPEQAAEDKRKATQLFPKMEVKSEEMMKK